MRSEVFVVRIFSGQAPLRRDFQKAASEELFLKGLAAPTSSVHQMWELPHTPKIVQKRVCNEVTIRKKPAFDAAAQITNGRSLVAKHYISLCNLVGCFRIANPALDDLILEF